MNYKTKQILKYLVKNLGARITHEEIQKKFKLNKMDYVKIVRPLYNKDIIVISNDNIFATGYSKYYLKNLKIQIMKKIIWSFIIPIVVSIITTLLTIWLTALFQ